MLYASNVYDVVRMGQAQASHAAQAARAFPGKPAHEEAVSPVAATAVLRAAAAAAADGDVSAQPAAPTIIAECLVDQQGVYMVIQSQQPAQNPDVDLAATDIIPGSFSEVPVAVNETDTQIAQLYTYTFNLDYRSLSDNDRAMADFKQQLQKAFLAGVAGVWEDGPSLADSTGALKLAYVLVANVRPGSVVSSARSAGSVLVDVYFTPPKGSTPLQLQKLADLAPADLISSSSTLQLHLLSGELVKQYSKDYHKSMAAGAIAGIAVTVTVVVTAAVLLALMLPRWRARRAGSTGSTADTGGSCCAGLVFGGGPWGNPAAATGENAAEGGAAALCSKEENGNNITDKVMHNNFLFYCQSQDDKGKTDGGMIGTAVAAAAAAAEEGSRKSGAQVQLLVKGHSSSCELATGSSVGGSSSATSDSCGGSAGASSSATRVSDSRVILNTFNSAGGEGSVDGAGNAVATATRRCSRSSSSSIGGTGGCRRSRCEACNHHGNSQGGSNDGARSSSSGGVLAASSNGDDSRRRWQL